MNNASALIAILEFTGSPPYPNPWSTAAFISAAINGLVLLYDISHIFFKEKINIKVGYFLLGFASLIGTICDVVYFATYTHGARGLETLTTVYHGLFWLSCILTILQLVKGFEKYNSRKTNSLVNWCTGLTISWFFICISIAIASEVLFQQRINPNIDDDGFDYSASISLARFVYLCRWFYVVMLVFLHVKYFSKLKKAYPVYSPSMVFLTIFAIIPVIFETLSVTIIFPSSALLNFVFSDLLTLHAMFIFLHFAKKWIPSLEQPQETAYNNNDTA